ncbi:DUF3427 domain-containing protein [Polaromonas sp.]|uniref:DUF3427 domain-containing protein n=1 Tax=Polaromonas sp. TaxID=1869339 RepID=UPI0017DB8DDC|nr:DUF3427 domain-containing protein [Polaromonas sp.]NMM07426.1 DUF3427 domain-containing protein [Polaromonas sp.]
MVMTLDKGPSGRIRGLRELLVGMTRQDVLLALQAFSPEAAQDSGYGESTDYDLIHEGHAYPPKAIFGFAAQRIAGRTLSANEFSGGESSPCFLILRLLGFEIVNKKPTLQGKSLVAGLVRGKTYDRFDVSQIFEPGCNFTRGAGRWGISGIVEVPQRSGNFVFLVTLEKPHEGNPYQDALTEDGYLIWESQSRHELDSPAIQEMLGHDLEQNNIHLFLRGNAASDYTYFGLLEYFSHDPNSTKPVHFIWRILNWDFEKTLLQSLGITLRAPLDPSYTPTTQTPKVGRLVQVDPPSLPRDLASAARTRRKVVAPKKSVDWAARDARNRRLGLEGEKLIFQLEIDELTAGGQSDLAAKVKHIALVDSAVGYDIASFAPDGTPKRIEVKTTQGPLSAPFFISINEVLASREDPLSYWIYRVFSFKPDSGEAKYFVINGDVEDTCELMATNFRAKPGKSGFLGI